MRALNTMELERLIVIMRKMQQHASCGKWQELESLDNERRALLKYDASVELSRTDSQTAEQVQNNSDANQKSDSASSALPEHQHSSIVEEIRNLDKQIISEVQAAREKLLIENRGLNAQVKAKNLYALTNSIP